MQKNPALQVAFALRFNVAPLGQRFALSLRHDVVRVVQKVVSDCTCQRFARLRIVAQVFIVEANQHVRTLCSETADDEFNCDFFKERSNVEVRVFFPLGQRGEELLEFLTLGLKRRSLLEGWVWLERGCWLVKGGWLLEG